MLLAIIVVVFCLFDSLRLVASRPAKPAILQKTVQYRDTPKVSFLVPAWEASHDIPRFLYLYNSLSYPKKELILCAGGNDKSYEIAKKYRNNTIIVIQQQLGQGKQNALAQSFLQADGGIIYLTDIDCDLNDETVRNLLTPLICGHADVVTGASRPRDEQLNSDFVTTNWSTEIVVQPSTTTDVKGILGRNAALKRQVIDITSAFDVTAPSGTDYTLAKEVLKAGYTICYVPGFPMPSEYPESVKSYIQKQSRWIRNVFVIGIRYKAWDEVLKVTTTLFLPYLLILIFFLALLLPSKYFAALFIMANIHAIINRLLYRKRAGFNLNIGASVQSYIADQCAALRSSWEIILGKMVW